MQRNWNVPNRRSFMTLIAGGAAATLAAPAVGRAGTKEVEDANEKVVLECCKAIETCDPDKVAPYLADDFQTSSSSFSTANRSSRGRRRS